MSKIEEKITSLGHQLPTVPPAAGNYLPYRKVDSVLYLSGALATTADGKLITGRVGEDKTLEEGYEAARYCVLNLLGVVKSAVGSLDKIKQVVTVSGFVNVAPHFYDVPQVINGASDFLVEVLGEAGKHARAAVGVASLPKNSLVEVQLVVEVAE